LKVQKLPELLTVKTALCHMGQPIRSGVGHGRSLSPGVAHYRGKANDRPD
jgi:hypothetical protein